jgi:hypothetical protein
MRRHRDDGLILFVAAASLYATILGYSRVPYAAARDGDFFRVFAHVHPTKRFRTCRSSTDRARLDPVLLLHAGQLVSWLIQVQVLLRFIWQCAAVILPSPLSPGHPATLHDVALTLWPRGWLLRRALALSSFFTGPWEVDPLFFVLRFSCSPASPRTCACWSRRPQAPRLKRPSRT